MWACSREYECESTILWGLCTQNIEALMVVMIFFFDLGLLLLLFVLILLVHDFRKMTPVKVYIEEWDVLLDLNDETQLLKELQQCRAIAHNVNNTSNEQLREMKTVDSHIVLFICAYEICKSN